MAAQPAVLHSARLWRELKLCRMFASLVMLRHGKSAAEIRAFFSEAIPAGRAGTTLSKTCVMLASLNNIRQHDKIDDSMARGILESSIRYG